MFHKVLDQTTFGKNDYMVKLEAMLSCMMEGCACSFLGHNDKFYCGIIFSSIKH